jgi:hypothetical protein
MIIASAGYYGLMPRALEFAGLAGAAASLVEFQAGFLGLLVYGLLVFAMEFLPFGAVNPQEVSEYFSAVRGGEPRSGTTLAGRGDPFGAGCPLDTGHAFWAGGGKKSRGCFKGAP